MKLSTRKTKELIEAIAHVVIDHMNELTELDRVIGDADHGINLERGFRAVLKNIDNISALAIGPSLDQVGRTLVMAVGGASGPLFGTFFMSMGKTFGEDETLTHERLVVAFGEAVEALKARGRSEAGQKTMLDVLIPVAAELHVDGPGTLRRIRECALLAAQATIPMVAQRGRASFLGERSAGHMDPGARSSQLIIAAVCSFIEERL